MTDRKRYYAVHTSLTSGGLEYWGVTREEMQTRLGEQESEYGHRTWTISTDPDEEGWDTDDGYQGSGGLTRAEAEWLAEAANERLEREGRLND
jgi:hypothetical protein